jgi:hypothetical protein
MKFELGNFLKSVEEILLIMKNVSDICCRENQNILCSVTYFRKSCSFLDNVGKYGRTGQATDDNKTAASALHAG